MSDHREIPEVYSAGLTACTTLEALRAHVAAYADLAKDAAVVVAQMQETDVPEFLRGLALERRKQFAGDAWAQRFMPLIMPEPMFTVALVAESYMVPFMVALRRLKDVRPDLLDVRPAEAAVDPSVADTGKPSTRVKRSSSF